MRLLDGEDNLLADLFLEDVIRVGSVSSCVDNRELGTAPLASSIVSVAGHACCFVYNRLSHADEAVEKCGLTYVRTSYDC